MIQASNLQDPQVILPTKEYPWGFSFSLPRRGFRKRVLGMTPELIQASTSAKKLSLPLLHGDSALGECLIFADFDNLPSFASSYSQLESMLEVKFSGSAIILRTPSNKLKLAFRLSGNWDSEDKKLFLQKQLSGILGNLWNMKVETKDDSGKLVMKPCIDKLDTAINSAFCTNEMIKKLKLEWATVKVFNHKEFKAEKKKAIVSSVCEDVIEPVTKPVRQWNLFEGALPNIDVTKLEEQTLRFILGWQKKAINGLDCPVNFIASVLKKDTRNVSKALKSLEKKGLIECVSDFGKTKEDRKFNGRKFYTPARTYRICGVLVEFAKSLVQKIKYQTSKIREAAFKGLELIQNGEWHSKLFDIARAAKGDSEAFWSHLEGIPGIDKKGRRNKAQKVWEWCQCSQALVK